MSRKKLIRAKFREAVYKRDNYSCRMCGATEGHLDAHHITDRNEMPGGGYVVQNGISLCEECHLEAERFHSSNGEEWEEGWHPDDLYAVIGSSYEAAFRASEAKSLWKRT